MEKCEKMKKHILGLIESLLLEISNDNGFYELIMVSDLNRIINDGSMVLNKFVLGSLYTTCDIYAELTSEAIPPEYSNIIEIITAYDLIY